jgi:hypothetical protein
VGTAPASASEAMDMVYAGLGWLAAADATALGAETQARRLRMLERVTAMGTAARASILAAFTSGQGYCADADYSPRERRCQRCGAIESRVLHSWGPWLYVGTYDARQFHTCGRCSAKERTRYGGLSGW